MLFSILDTGERLIGIFRQHEREFIEEKFLFPPRRLPSEFLDLFDEDLHQALDPAQSGARGIELIFLASAVLVCGWEEEMAGRSILSDHRSFRSAIFHSDVHGHLQRLEQTGRLPVSFTNVKSGRDILNTLAELRLLGRECAASTHSRAA